MRESKVFHMNKQEKNAILCMCKASDDLEKCIVCKYLKKNRRMFMTHK